MRIGCVGFLLLFVTAGAVTASAQTTAFVGGRVIDGTGRVIDNGTVVISGARITAVGPASTPYRRARRASISRARPSCPAW